MNHQKIQCLLHSDIYKFKYGFIVSIGKETLFVKYEETGEIVEYSKKFLGKELEIIID